MDNSLSNYLYTLVRDSGAAVAPAEIVRVAVAKLEDEITELEERIMWLEMDIEEIAGGGY